MIKPLNICYLNFMDVGGGAATACLRLINAMQLQNHSCTYLVAQKTQNNDYTFGAYHNANTHKVLMAFERYYLKFKETSLEYRFQFSIPKWGVDISKHKAIKQADIIHIHWPHRSFLDIKGLKKLTQLGKPIVWTLHDMWAMTGGCHYTANCSNYLQQCGNCYMLKNQSKNDLSAYWWKKKNDLFNTTNIQFVTCSKWLKKEAQQSGLLKNQAITAIPNPINSTIFKPIEKTKTLTEFGLNPNKKYLLFLAMSANDERKGFAYLKEGLRKLKENYNTNNYELLVVGGADKKTLSSLPIPTKHLGKLSDWKKIVAAYNAADVFIIPSLQDNLPNSIMEALACGTPAVGFNTGGTPEMVEHQQNGYIANYKDSEDLAKGINWVLQNPKYQQLCTNARQKVLNDYDMAIVAQKFETLYHSLLD